ncbi:hypothetical protein CQ050_27745 [Achromobacter sp. MYb9]|uniref:WG repeat-containing protein n=1 Tax=Achromobacter sp. MYb9 TaxID=1827284 RepID=UPI000CFAAEF9|nr:WG repeat-containing protein [Achromobacter sp. MYb9]PQZ58140.1 hypothetical protein CQ050_27745 [Achromobacter sp. MYb9]
MTSRVIRTTRLACAIAALGASLSAHAQSGHLYCLEEGSYRTDTNADDISNSSPFTNGCIRALSDGRAAVLLPSALENINRVPMDQSLRRHAWGFLDSNGRLAIRPLFEDVRDFRHGLAAVQWKGKWGFIDTRGRMAVPPRFDSVQDYAEIGLAVAMLDGRQQLIDRQGQPVGEPLDTGIQNLFLADGVPARAAVQYKQEYRGINGERRFAKPGITITQSYGQGLYIAINDEHRYGVVDGDWNWVVEPAYEDILTQHDSRPAVAYSRDGAVLIGTDGKVTGADQHYNSLQPVGKAFWSAELDGRKGYAVLDAAGAVVTTMKPDEAQESQRFQDTLVYPVGETLMALVPGQPAPIKLSGASTPTQNEEGFVIFADQTGAPAGVLTPKGVWLGGDTAPAWLPQAGPMELRHGRLWIRKQEGGLLNVLDADGRVLLKPEAVEATQSMELKAPPLNIPGAPLGILGQGHCQCGMTGAGLILADGSWVTDPWWTDLIALDDSDERRVDDPEYQDGPNALKPEQLRYAAETERGLQLLDANGKPLPLPPQQHIGTFRHGYALTYAAGVNRMIDREGKTYDLPDVFQTDIVAPGVVRFLKTASEDARWGLYDFVAGKELAAPAFHQIGHFQNGQAVASLGADRVGVIDLQGRWVVPAAHHGVARINDKLWKVWQAGGQAEDYERAAAVFNDQGRALTSFQPHLQVTAAAGGTISADGEQNRWIVSADGSSALDLQDATYARVGDWLEIRRAVRYGYLNAQGAWQIPPTAAVGSIFQGTPARALSTDATGTRLIDATGKTVSTLPDGEWRWPQGSDWLLRHYVANGKPMTEYTGPDGKPRMKVEGTASAFSAGRAVTLLSTRAVRAVDAKGALSGPAFDALGALHDGLAAARTDLDFGYVDGQGKFVIPTAYSAVTPFAGKRAVVSTMDLSKIIDPAGNALARVEMVCGMRALYGSAGQRLWPLSLPARCRR